MRLSVRQNYQANKNTSIAFVYGRVPQSVCGVRDYGMYLEKGLQSHGIKVKHIYIPWDTVGWQKSITLLQSDIHNTSISRVCIHYTALSWSRKGFSFNLFRVIKAIKKKGIPVIIIFHDSFGHPGDSLLYRARRSIQHICMRYFVALSDAAVISSCANVFHWIPFKYNHKITTIPVGSNIIPSSEEEIHAKGGHFNIVVFGISIAGKNNKEERLLTETMQRVSQKIANIQLHIIGIQGNKLSVHIKKLLEKSGIKVMVYGNLPTDDLSSILRRSDVQFFVRERIGAHNGTAIAGVAHGLPIVAQESKMLVPPLSQAGILTFPEGNTDIAACHIIQILQDKDTREYHSQKSKKTYQEYFTWDSIAKKYLAILRVQYSE